MAGTGHLHTTLRSKDPASASSACPRFWLQDDCSSAELVLRGTHELGPPSDPSVLAGGDPGAAAQLDVCRNCQWEKQVAQGHVLLVGPRPV